MKSTWINLFKIYVMENHCRIVFGDAVLGPEGDYHTSIIMSHDDAKELSQLINKLISDEVNKKVGTPTS